MKNTSQSIEPTEKKTTGYEHAMEELQLSVANLENTMEALVDLVSPFLSSTVTTGSVPTEIDKVQTSKATQSIISLRNKIHTLTDIVDDMINNFAN